MQLWGEHFHLLWPYAHKYAPPTCRYHLSWPFGPGHRSGLHRGETSPRCEARFHRLLCRLLTSPMWSERVAPLSAKIQSHATSQRAHGRSPGAQYSTPLWGVNTCLSVRECRVYGHTLRWIEDFALMCRLVPMCNASYPIPVRHPVPLRYLAVARRLPPEASSPIPRRSLRLPTIPLRPSPPSGWA